MNAIKHWEYSKKTKQAVSAARASSAKAKRAPAARVSTPERRGGAGHYSPHPSIKMVQDWVAALPEKTGRTLAQWLKHIREAGPATEDARREWLARQFKLGTNTIWWLAERSVGKGREDDDPEAYLAACPGMVDAMYAGKRAALRPIHDALIDLGRSLGKDVGVCPCKTIVPFYRNHVFAQVKPATNTRIDFGLALGDPSAVRAAPARLIDTGGFRKKDRITHKFEIMTLGDIDRTVEKWLHVAYVRDA